MLSLLAGTDVDVEAMEEGSLFLPFETVFSIEGPYGAFCETGDGDAGDDLPGVRDRHGGVAGQARGRREAGPELRGPQDAPRPLDADRPERLHRRRGRRLRDPQRRVPRRNAAGDDAARPRPGPRRHGDGDARLRRGGRPGGAAGLPDRHAPGREVRGPPGRGGVAGTVVRRPSRHPGVAPRRLPADPPGGAVGAGPARLPARAPVRLRRAGRGRGADASRRGRRLRRRDLPEQRSYDRLRARHRGSRGNPVREAGEAVGPQAGVRMRSVRRTDGPPRRGSPGHCPCGGAREGLLRPALRAGRPLETPSPPRAIRDRVLRQVERFHAREEHP